MKYPYVELELLESIEKLNVNEETKTAMVESMLGNGNKVYDSVDELMIGLGLCNE